jgi:hypothetical protein
MCWVLILSVSLHHSAVAGSALLNASRFSPATAALTALSCPNVEAFVKIVSKV